MRFSILLIFVLASSAFAQDWFSISPSPSWRTGSLQTYQNPALGARSPWERKNPLGISFETAFSMTGGMSGNSHGRLLDFKDRADRTIDKYLNHTAIPSHPTDIVDTYRPVVLLINDFYNLKDAPKGDGYQLASVASAGFTMQDLFMPRDAISLRYSQFAFQGWNFSLDKYLNQNLRIYDSSQWAWLADIDTAYNSWPSSYNKSPLTPAGWRYVPELVAAGYSQRDSEFIAFLLESAGLDFGSPAADTFLQWLRNTLVGTGDSILDADVLEGNKSGIGYRQFLMAEMGLTYSFSIPGSLIEDWFTFGITAKYLQASRASSYRVGGSPQDAFLHPFQGMSDSRKAFGLDLGVVFTPQIPYLDKLAVSLSIRNANAPSFSWGHDTYRLQPQARLGMSLAPMTAVVPIMIGFDVDLNRIDNLVLPGYHTQQFRFQFEINPNLDPVNFSIRMGTVCNVGDSGEPLQLHGGFGLKLWWFTLDFAGESSLDVIYKSGSIFGLTLPSRFGFTGKLGFDISW